MDIAKDTWWMKAKIYELYIDKFAGDLPGLTARLDYFIKLGIDCLHILPHYPSPMDDEGYDVSDYRGVRPELGTVEDMQTLFREAERRGLKVIVDLVLNHVSVEHPWFQEARQFKDSPKRDYFLWSEDGSGLEGSANPFIDFKPSNWIANPETDDFYFSTFKPSQADLNWDSPEVLKEILEVMDYLVDLGADGFRLDAVAHLVKRERTDSRGLPETHQIIMKLRAHIDRYYPDVILLGEVSGRMDSAQSYFGNGDECHLVYSFQLAAAMLYALRVGDNRPLDETMLAFSQLPPQCAWVAFLRNHDEINLASFEPDRRRALVDLLDPEREFPFRNGEATSQRLMNALGGDPKLVKEAFRLLYSLPMATVMYYGDEIGQENLPLPPGTADTRLAVRGPFDWEEAERLMKNPDSLWGFAAGL